MNFGMLRGIFKSHLEMPSFCYPGASRNKSGINSSAIGFMLLVITLSLVACGDGSGTSANDDLSSGSIPLSGTSVTSNGSKASSSSKKESSSSRVNSVGSSSVGKSSSSSSAKKASSSSVYVEACSEEGHFIQRTKFPTKEKEWYICENGYYVLYVQSSSSQKVLTFKESFKKDSVFNDEIEYGTFKDSRDGQEYKTVVIKSKYEQFEVFAQNLNYGTQIKLGITEFDDEKVEKYCYDDDPWYCENYFGGMYSWSEAMGLPKACDSVWTGTTPECPDSVAAGIVYDSEWDDLQIQGACPEGWHVMNGFEWRTMIGADESNWRVLSKIVSGTNASGFSALFGGMGSCGGPSGCKFGGVLEYGDFWLPKETDKEFAGVCAFMTLGWYSERNATLKNNVLPVRCVKDYKEDD